MSASGSQEDLALESNVGSNEDLDIGIGITDNSFVEEGESQELSIYKNAVLLLSASQLMYAFATIMAEARKGNLVLNPEIYGNFNETRLDVTEINNHKGMSVKDVLHTITRPENAEKMKEFFTEFDQTVINTLQEIEEKTPQDTMFLQTFNSLKQEEACVYAVMKDEHRKRIIITFRGSVGGNEDWNRNFQAFNSNIKVSPVISSLMEDKYNETVLVHQGFREYLFDNDHRFPKERIEEIVTDVNKVHEPGYQIYVSGHSLGGALASLLAYRLGGGKEDWIPKPVNCITFSSPMVGSEGFRLAFEKLEEKGLVRYFRITNNEDVVPAVPPISFGFDSDSKIKRLTQLFLYKHVGIHLDFYSDSFVIDYPNRKNRWKKAIRNSFLKKSVFEGVGTFFRRGFNTKEAEQVVTKYHGMGLVFDRLKMHKEELDKVTLKDLYEDKSLMGKESELHSEL